MLLVVLSSCVSSTGSMANSSAPCQSAAAMKVHGSVGVGVDLDDDDVVLTMGTDVTD